MTVGAFGPDGWARLAQFSIHFTLAQANALLPWVRAMFVKIHRIMDELPLPSAGGAAEPVHLPAPRPNGNGHGNGHGAAGLAPADKGWMQLDHPQKIALINGLLAAIGEKGVVIQDIRRGLIDFPSWRQGQEILLCYELADGERIAHWHEPHAGFIGRRPVDETFAADAGPDAS
jgi:hypothetical protein